MRGARTPAPRKPKHEFTGEDLTILNFLRGNGADSEGAVVPQAEEPDALTHWLKTGTHLEPESDPYLVQQPDHIESTAIIEPFRARVGNETAPRPTVEVEERAPKRSVVPRVQALTYSQTGRKRADKISIDTARRIGGLLEERALLTIALAGSMGGETSIGRIAHLASQSVESDQPVHELADKLYELAERRLVTTGLVELSAHAPKRAERRVVLTATGRDVAPLACGLINLSAGITKGSLSELFPFRTTDTGSYLPQYIGLMRKLAKHKRAEPAELVVKKLGGEMRTAFLQRLVQLGLITPAPIESTTALEMPEYTRGVYFDSAIRDAKYMESAVLRAIRSLGDGVVFNPRPFLDREMKVVPEDNVDQPIEVIQASERLVRRGALRVVRTSRIISPDVCVIHPAVREFTDLIDAHLTRDPQLTDHAAEVMAQLMSGQYAYGRLSLGETLAKSMSRTMRSVQN